MHLVKQTQSHALKNLARSKHRWQWTLILSILLICSIVVMWIWIERYLENPTYIVRLEASKMDTQFPAVMVFPEVAFAGHRIESFVKQLKYPPGLNKTYTRKVIPQLAAFFSPDVTYKLTDLENIQSILDYNSIDIETAGLNLTESCEESITRCRWQGDIVKCSQLFEMTLTAYGFCCIFNGRSLRRYMMNEQLQDKNLTVAQKLYKNSDFANGLMLVINQSQAKPFDVDISYKWLSIHGSQGYIDLPGNGTPITPGTELSASYSTDGLKVDEETVNLNKDLRRCRMSYESLQYFPIYHKKHCLFEREMKMAVSLCGCLKIGHLQLPGVPVCRAQNLLCARQATVSVGKCDNICPMTCDAEQDRVTLQTYDLDPNSSPYDSFYYDLDFSKITIVRVHAWNRNRKMFSRKPYFTRFQLFAQLGGVFSVFFGCSVLSILELAMVIRRAFWTWISTPRRFRGYN
ncbi:unnamed protein product, partial [Iphiclides podalirius]